MTAFIWDLDGTLIDSYPVTLLALEATYRHFGLNYDRAYIEQYIIEHSIRQLIQDLVAAGQVAYRPFVDYLKQETAALDGVILLMPQAKETLQTLQAQGARHFIYTHKDNSAYFVLENLGIAPYFQEVITIEQGFKRKPDSEAIDYLVAKYQLDKSNTYYVGDRLLDVEAAKQAGIKSLNLGVASDEGNQRIHTLSDIIDLVTNK